MASSPPAPERRTSRIAAARERAANAKAALVASALLAFFGAILVERGTAAAKVQNSAPASAPTSVDGSDGFDSGSIAPSQGPPSASTSVS